MKTKILVAASVAAILAVSIFALPLASAVGDFLAVKQAKIESKKNGLEAKLITHGLIPKDGTGGAFGYGILTSAGLDGIIVATTHGGVLDSEVQKNPADPVWHTHFVRLGTSEPACNGAPNVIDITFESPGKLKVHGNEITFDKVPSTFTGTNPLTNSPTTITPGSDVQNVVSFVLDPKFDSGGNLQAVCVEDITPAEKLRIDK